MKTFGQTSRLDTVATTAEPDVKYAMTAELSRASRVVKMTAYLDGGGPGSGGQDVRGVIYSGDGTTLHGATEPLRIEDDQQAAWFDFTLADGIDLEVGEYRLGVHFGETAQAARYYGIADEGVSASDTYADGPSATFGTTSTAAAPAIFATYTNDWAVQLEDDAHYARYGFWSAQQVLGTGGVLPQKPPIVVTCGWHGTYLDPEPQGGSFGIVARNGDLTEYLGDRVQLRNMATGRSVIVYVGGEAELDVDDEISLSRRAFEALAELNAESVRVSLQPVGESQ